MRNKVNMVFGLVIAAALAGGCSLDGGGEQFPNQAAAAPLVSWDQVQESGGSLLISSFTLPKFCPPRVRNGGDGDFDGHGPLVSADVRLYAKTNCLYIEMTFNARETKSDWTRVAGRATRLVVVTSQPIKNILSPKTFSFSYLDTDHEDDAFSFGYAGLVRRMIVTGDTRGDDVGKCGVTYTTNTIMLELQ